MTATLTLFLFVKGTAATPVEHLVADAQVATALDTLEKLRTLSEIGALVVSTADTAFADRAAALGAAVEMDPPDASFHFGRRLAHLVAKYRAAVPLYVGGGSGGLMRVEDWRALARRILAEPGTVISNNFYSCDFAAWSPGDALDHIEPPALDNDLAFRLGDLARSTPRLRVGALPKNAATQLDIDTPTDLMTVAALREQGVGSHLRAFLDSTALDTSRATRIKALLKTRSATLLVAGRVSASMALFLERETLCQWRIFSEERGMRASGREERGEARSLLGYFLDRSSPAELFDTLGKLADGILIDTRVLFAHRGLHPAAPDRFYSDLLTAEQVADPFIREFTAAARAAPYPVLLGGHSLVSGGMYALAQAGL